MAHFQLDPVKVWKFFSKSLQVLDGTNHLRRNKLCFPFPGLVEEGYHSNNPYHNAIHAADVTQAMHCFLQEEKV